MTGRAPMIEWAISTVYATWHARKVYHDGRFVRLCDMRYEIHHTEDEPPIGATICSMCAARLSSSLEHTLRVLLLAHDVIGQFDGAHLQTDQAIDTIRATLGAP